MLRPRTTPTRELVNLDGLWHFALDGGPDPLDTSLEVAVPASYNDQFTARAIREHVGWAWYQRQVRVPRGWAGERVILRLDAATHEGKVYVDDVMVARHVGGCNKKGVFTRDRRPKAAAHALRARWTSRR